MNFTQLWLPTPNLPRLPLAQIRRQVVQQPVENVVAVGQIPLAEVDEDVVLRQLVEHIRISGPVLPVRSPLSALFCFRLVFPLRRCRPFLGLLTAAGRVQ